MSGATVHPSGRQHQLRHADQAAVVTQVGACLREYEVAGHPVLDGYGPDEMAHFGRGQVLVPWPNRLAGGRYELGGETFQLPLSEPEQDNAIHGLVRWGSWDVLDQTASRVRLGHVLWPQTGYPFTLALEVEYELSAGGLRVTIRAENAGTAAAPYGAGQHPYIRLGAGGIDEDELRLPGARWMETDVRQIPTGRVLDVAGTDYDFREPRRIEDTRLDTAFTDLRRDDDGLARVELRQVGGHGRVVVWMDAGFDYVMAFTGDTLPEGQRRRGLGVEPMTCAPDAFRSGRGLRVLEPGERTTATWGITASV